MNCWPGLSKFTCLKVRILGIVLKQSSGVMALDMSEYGGLIFAFVLVGVCMMRAQDRLDVCVGVFDEDDEIFCEGRC